MTKLSHYKVALNSLRQKDGHYDCGAGSTKTPCLKHCVVAQLVTGELSESAVIFESTWRIIHEELKMEVPPYPWAKPEMEVISDVTYAVREVFPLPYCGRCGGRFDADTCICHVR